MSSTPQMGPVALCTLIARDGQAVADAYQAYMHQQITAVAVLDGDTAQALGLAELAGQPSWTLSNTAGRQWLQVIEYPQANDREALNTYGWLAMEVLVEDVDTLANSLENSPFELLRQPADLDISDKIRACQARGPAGEILYLTQVQGTVPPFELPTCQAPVDHLFIPVLSTPSRENSLEDYKTISGNEGLCFDTRITVINQARNFAIDQKHPVATLQLADCTLIEIDQIADTTVAPGGLCSGVANIAFHCQHPTAHNAQPLASGSLAGYSARAFTGSAGERFTLVYS